MSDPRDSKVPIGTYEELIEHDLSPKVYGSCSAPAGDNIGCPAFRKCRFIQYRDRMNGLKGPDNVGIMVVTNENAPDGKIMLCHEYYISGLDNVRANADKNNFIVQIQASPGGCLPGTGTHMLTQGSTRAHLKPDPNCPDCQRKTCYRIKRFERNVEVTHFVRLGELAESGTTDQKMQLGYGERLRAQHRKSIEKEQEQAMFERERPEPKTIKIAAHEAPGTGRFTKKPEADHAAIPE